MDSVMQAVLPAELEKEIFEVAAFLHPECILALVLVARRVHIWIEHLLYHTLAIHIEVPIPQIFRLPLRAAAKMIMERPSSIIDHALHVCFVNMQQTDVAFDFLSKCGATVDLAFFSSRSRWYDSDPDLSILPRTLPLQRLSFTLKSLKQLFPYPSPFDGGHPFFSRITHLHILDYIDGDSNWHTWSGLATIPHLTHLAASAHYMASESVLRGMLRHCKLLEVLVFVLAPQFELEKKLEVAERHFEAMGDPRIVVLVVKDGLADWEAGSRGGEDYWAKASTVVEKRRAAGT